MSTTPTEDLGFSYQVTKTGCIRIYRQASLVRTVGAEKAASLIAKLERLDLAAQQQILARLTGNYKRGNERQSGDHPRNRPATD